MHVYTTLGDKFSLLRSGYITVYWRKSLLPFFQLPGSILDATVFSSVCAGQSFSTLFSCNCFICRSETSALPGTIGNGKKKKLLIMGISPAFLCQELVAFQAGNSKLPLKPCTFTRFLLTMTRKKATSRKSPIAMDTAFALWWALRKKQNGESKRRAGTAPASPTMNCPGIRDGAQFPPHSKPCSVLRMLMRKPCVQLWPTALSSLSTSWLADPKFFRSISHLLPWNF